MSTTRRGLRVWQVAVLAAMPLLAALFALCLGRMTISPLEVLTSLAGKLGQSVETVPQTEMVLWNIRLPRIILALLAGAGLSVSGCVFQGLFANPLATPDTLGVASGSAFGAALALLLGLSLTGVQLFAMLFGLSAVAITYLCGRGSFGGNGSGSSMVLAGIMVGSLFAALISLVKFTADTESQLPAITYWLMGSLSSAGYTTLATGAPPIVIGITVLLLLRWRLNLLPLSDDEARASGTNMTLLRAVCAVCAAGITASCVSMCGQVGWVGLLVPHLCRMLFGGDNRVLVPASASVGAAFMIIVDTAARSLTAAEIPVSILTAIIGAPFFIVLMRKTRSL